MSEVQKCCFCCIFYSICTHCATAETFEITNCFPVIAQRAYIKEHAYIKPGMARYNSATCLIGKTSIFNLPTKSSSEKASHFLIGDLASFKSILTVYLSDVVGKVCYSIVNLMNCFIKFIAITNTRLTHQVYTDVPVINKTLY